MKADVGIVFEELRDTVVADAALPHEVISRTKSRFRA
jgi:hypothetical protein